MENIINVSSSNFCLLLDIFLFFSMAKNIHSKHEYFNDHLKKERDELNKIKETLFELKENAINNLNTNDSVCSQCWYSIYKINYNYVWSYILKYKRSIKHSYNNTVYPMQHFLMEIFVINTISMSMIFETPFQLFFVSSLLTIISLCIQAELFIADVPNVYYTLFIGICICLFSIILLLKMIITLLTVFYYQMMKDILTTE